MIGFATSLMAVVIGYHIGRLLTKIYLRILPPKRTKKIIKVAKEKSMFFSSMIVDSQGKKDDDEGGSAQERTTTFEGASIESTGPEEDGVAEANDLLFPDEKAPVNFLEVVGEDNWADAEEAAYARGNVETLGRALAAQPKRAAARITTSVVFSFLALVLMAITFIIVIVLIPFRKEWIRLYFALLTAPFGALLRHLIVSKNVKLGPKSPPW